MEAPTSSLFHKKHMLIYLDISFVLFLLQYCPPAFLSFLYLLWFFTESLSAPPSSYPLCLKSLFSNLFNHINLISFIEFTSWLFVFPREFKVNRYESLPSTFLFYCLEHLEKYNNMYTFQYYSGVFLCLRRLAFA